MKRIPEKDLREVAEGMFNDEGVWSKVQVPAALTHLDAYKAGFLAGFHYGSDVERNAAAEKKEEKCSK